LCISTPSKTFSVSQLRIRTPADPVIGRLGLYEKARDGRVHG
jgi:hypothetical protein